MSETKIMRDIQLAATDAGHRLFRCNSGTGWQGRVTIHDHAHICLSNPRVLRAGLCVGCSDLIGWRSVTITEEMIGRNLAVFLAVEVKTQTGRLSKEQKNFLNIVNLHGGIGLVAKSVDEALRGINENRFSGSGIPIINP